MKKSKSDAGVTGCLVTLTIAIAALGYLYHVFF